LNPLIELELTKSVTKELLKPDFLTTQNNPKISSPEKSKLIAQNFG